MESLWAKNSVFEPRERLTQDESADVAVIGAGITGLLTAWFLQEAGLRVVVLEANRIAGGQTQNTTAKITAQHGYIYRPLIEKHGEDKAWQYAQANAAAIEDYRRIIRDKRISCAFEEQDAYLYSRSNAALMRDEAEAARLLGLPSSFTENVPLPFPTAGAVKFARQAQFNPLQFLQVLARELTIFENTRVLSVEENQLSTADAAVSADHIVFACHYPFINFPGLYFTRMHQERSYVLALENAPFFDGMLIDEGAGGYSFRHYGPYLLLGGGSHRTGENSAGGRYDDLRRKAAEWFPQAHEAARWSAQDVITADGVPYIGRFASSRPQWYVATGFQKWGMTTAMAAATILRDTILEKPNPFAEVFSPSRFAASDIPAIAREGIQAVKGLTRENLSLPKETLDSLPVGHGGIVEFDEKKVGIYKADDSTIYVVDTRCPHLGCQLAWNPDEKTWDCPCHGSRFDFTGRLLDAPAQSDISIR